MKIKESSKNYPITSPLVRGVRGVLVKNTNCRIPFKELLFSFLIVTLFKPAFSQTDNVTYSKEIKEFQKELNAEFADKEKSCLLPKDRRKFKGLDYFPINENFRVVAKLIRTENEVPFKMKTTTDRLPIYQKYGEIHFTLDGKQLELSLYQNLQLSEKEEYKDYLFLAFTDLTNGNESYGGGRFMDLKIPEGDTIIIDFNKSYNPLCAYNHSYSCPIPPKENFLDLAIKAGVMAFQEH
ncbi:MAG: hypothetical protein COX70_09460 [Flavobacteriales bacterium CG_4_10_14_0_2_um_filter_32_8]|nr:MAG: hypothetical protein COX70_09460 [Flavobacteriales bacterium CG_4_10_14_0_2_um_filter_32_8]